MVYQSLFRKYTRVRSKVKAELTKKMENTHGCYGKTAGENPKKHPKRFRHRFHDSHDPPGRALGCEFKTNGRLNSLVGLAPYAFCGGEEVAAECGNGKRRQIRCLCLKIDAAPRTL
jgi:hypothetical protein